MSGTIDKYVSIDEENAKWFNETYPKGSFGWLFNMLLAEFRQAHTMTPQDYGAIGARTLKKKLEENGTT